AKHIRTSFDSLAWKISRQRRCQPDRKSEGKLPHPREAGKRRIEMMMTLATLLLTLTFTAVEPGDHTLTLHSGGHERVYLLHVPKDYDAEQPTPLLLVYHGAAMSCRMMARYTSLSDKSDEAGFIVVYPQGMGRVPTWNSSALPTRFRADDVAFTAD